EYQVEPLPLHARHETGYEQLDERPRERPDEGDEVPRAEIPGREAGREPEEGAQHEPSDRRRARHRHGAVDPGRGAGSAEGRAEGSARVQTSQTISTSSMMSACHKYRCAHSKASKLHWPR